MHTASAVKRWAVLVVLLYALALLVLSAPVFWLALCYHGGVAANEAWDIFRNWQYWLWLLVMLGGQATLLLVPLEISSRRPGERRPLKLPLFVSAFFVACLFFGGGLSLWSGILGDQAFPDWEKPDPLAFAGCALIFIGFWTFWALAFRAFTRAPNAETALARVTRWLLRGSVLELLIAVPTHVITRRRNDCCAQLGTFWGLTTGIALMLLCFGPGLFFLFEQRARRLRGARASMGTGQGQR